MKVTYVIILLLVIKAKASFFDDFKGAMSSVENAIGKLLSDVVTDVRSTVHCTILAMEQVLAINGVIQEPLPNKECSNDDFDIETKSNRKFYSNKDFAHEISSSISKVNKTLSHILDNNGHERIKDVKRLLKDESNRLTEVSFLLRSELEKISQRMKTHFKNIDLDSDKSSLNSVWNDMKLLYEVEKNDKNMSKEIGHVLNEALNVLHIDTSRQDNSDEDKIKAIMRELQQESNINSVPINIINQQLSQLKGIQTVPEIIPAKTAKGFKDIAAKVFEQNDKIQKKIKGVLSDKSSSFVNTKVSNKKTNSKDYVTQSSKTDLDNVSPFGETNSEDNAKAVQQAMDILKETAQTQALLDDFFAKEHGANAFENTNNFNLKK